MKKILSFVLLAITLSSTAAIAASGEDIYKARCFFCHDTGAANAPKLGDKDAWASRIAKGEDALVTSAINGIPGTAMTSRGGAADLTDADLKATVEYMMKSVQ